MSHSVANIQFFLRILHFAGWLHKFAYPRLHRCIPGGTVHSFQPVLISPIDLVNLYRYPSPLNHVLLRTTGMAGSCASSIMGAATTAVQIWYDTDLLGKTKDILTNCVQEQALHRSAMKTLPLLHNLRVCPEQGSFLFAVY